MMVLLGLAYSVVLSNVAVFLSGVALGVALESWRRRRNGV